MLFTRSTLLLAHCLGMLLALLTIGAPGVARGDDDLNLIYEIQPNAKIDPRKPLIILLHGSSSTEQDMLGLANAFPADNLLVSVRAPYPGEAGGYQWFQGRYDGPTYQGDAEQVERSRQALVTFIGDFRRRHRLTGPTYLVGFSQGAMMSYEVALSSPRLVNGLAALSGKLLAERTQWLKDKPAPKRLHVVAAHGSTDKVVAYSDGQQAARLLEAKGLPVQFRTYMGMGHRISEAELNDLQIWLAQENAAGATSKPSRARQ